MYSNHTTELPGIIRTIYDAQPIFPLAATWQWLFAGRVVIAGPVNTPEWTRRPRDDETIDQLRRLYPVSFYSQGTAQLKLGRFGGNLPFPLDFTRERRAAEFLWLGDSATDRQTNWDRFEGVFGYYAVNEPKPGADVLRIFRMRKPWSTSDLRSN